MKYKTLVYFTIGLFIISELYFVFSFSLEENNTESPQIKVSTEPEGTETFYYSETDTIKIHSVVWDRTKDKDPEKIIDPITYPKSSSEIPYATCGETVLALPYIVTIATMFSEARISEGYSCLQINSYLTDTAQNHADYLYLNGGELTRDEVEGLPGFTGTNWIERIIISGYPGSPALEFHAAGYDAESVAQAWLDNPANHQYLMDPTIGDMGVGYSGGNIWVADFGKP